MLQVFQPTDPLETSPVTPHSVKCGFTPIEILLAIYGHTTRPLTRPILSEILFMPGNQASYNIPDNHRPNREGL